MGGTIAVGGVARWMLQLLLLWLLRFMLLLSFTLLLLLLLLLFLLLLFVLPPIRCWDAFFVGLALPYSRTHEGKQQALAVSSRHLR